MDKVVEGVQAPSPTPEQEAILKAASRQSGSLMVEAGAGCGKTSTLEMASRRVKEPGLAIAFNKRIAEELDKRLPNNFVGKTMNSLGHIAWMKATGKGMKVDDRKGGKLISEISRNRRLNFMDNQWDVARQLFREAQIQGLVPQMFASQAMSIVPDTKEGWQALADSLAIDEDDFEYTWEVAREALVENIKLAFQGTISYDDQIYCSVLLGGRFNRYPVVFVDENQDLNPLQIQMVRRLIRGDGRMMSVGDKCQSIYAFRGAVGEAAEQLRALLPDWVDLPLMTSFRVPKLVAERQRGHVPLFRAFGANPTGRIITLGGDGMAGEGWIWKDLVAKVPEWPIDMAILCRNNAPIVSMAFRLIRQGVGCHVLGRDLGKGLKALSKKLAPEDFTPIDKVRAKIAQWMESELAKARANEEDANADKVDKIEDKGMSLLAVLDSTECKDAGQLRRQIDYLFSKENGQVTLSTIHKAKGLEWPVVVHLDPWRVPSKWAKKLGGRALEQEHNLKYVAETRTKHTLVFANLEGFQ